LRKHEVSAEVIEALRRFDSPTISNAIELFGVRPRNRGYVDSTIRALFPEMPPVVGFASTATFRASKPGEEGKQVSLQAQVEALLTLPAPRIVVFEDLDSPPAAATFGEVMCSVYKRFGCIGLITSGAGRDLDQVRTLGFAAFSSSVCVSHGYAHFEALHVPVRVGGLTIRPGDLIHADVNGIVVIPADIAKEVAELCPAYVDSERIILDYLKRAGADVAGLEESFHKHSANLRAFTQNLEARGRVPVASPDKGFV